MEPTTSVAELLQSFTASTESAIDVLPNGESHIPPENGMTLLDTKNEIFLSYLQALALRNLVIIRSLKEGTDAEATQRLSDDITKKLVEQRLFLEKGVRPLEQKLKYQIDRVLQVAEEEDRARTRRENQKAAKNGGAENGEADSDAESEEESDSDAELGADMAMSTNFKPLQSSMTAARTQDTEKTRREPSTSDGVYRPPRISATAMPTTERKEGAERRPGRSRTLDEYVSTELSTAPLAQPSIGSNLAAGGRQTKNARQLREEAERREYEETNLVRLPGMSKKEKARKGLGKARDGGFGGEEWRGLGESVDRIGDLTRKKSKDSVLDKSRKRRAVEDGPRGDGIGARFEMKKRRMQKKGQL